MSAPSPAPGGTFAVFVFTSIATILGVVALTFGAGVTQGAFAPDSLDSSPPFILTANATLLTVAIWNNVTLSLEAAGVSPGNIVVNSPYLPFTASFYTAQCSNSPIYNYHSSCPSLPLGQDLNIGLNFKSSRSDIKYLADGFTPVGTGENNFNIWFGPTGEFQPSNQQLALAKSLYSTIQSQLDDFPFDQNYDFIVMPSAISLVIADGFSFLSWLCLVILFIMTRVKRAPASPSPSNAVLVVRILHAVLSWFAVIAFTAAAALITVRIRQILNAPPPLAALPEGIVEVQTSATFLGTIWAAVGLSLLAGIGALLRLKLGPVAPPNDELELRQKTDTDADTEGSRGHVEDISPLEADAI